jgi:hypothetical protein
LYFLPHFFRVSPAFFFRLASSVRDHVNISELPRTPGATSPSTCSHYQHMTFQSRPPAGRQLEPASAAPPSLSPFFYLLCFTVLISSVPCQCPAMILSLSSSQTEPCYGRLAASLAMAGPSDSVLMHKFRTLHLLLFQRNNSRRVEWLLLRMCPIRKGRLSAISTPQIQRN